MSFNDLERGLGERAPLARDGPVSSDPDRDRQFKMLANRVTSHIFRINSNVSGIQKLVDLLGSSRDTVEIRARLHDLTESTREFVKNSSKDAKELAAWQVPDAQSMQRVEQQKVSRDYAAALQNFQRVSRHSAERQKHFVERAREEVANTSVPTDDADAVELSETRPQLQQQQQQQDLVPDSDLDYQEALIEERETEIREIETGIHELNEIFRDLGTIVQEQGGLIDNIESNVNSVHTDTRGAVEELRQAHEYQRRAGKRMLCLLLIFIVVLAVVLLAILA